MNYSLPVLLVALVLLVSAFDWSLDHERQHCLGFDHVGSDDMRAMLKDWKSRAH